ncbi:metalloprotease family protein [Halorhabdus rudnickae]|uniref:metalloprotease family protein n=1 Tax=Halorhabdus rudnickae TaxID=1775544 RepID=UPI0010841CE7|nr:metalloprotease family protein [Halorhabdus rudnickae]
MLSVRRYLLPIVMAPGVIVHELAHFFACVFTGVSVNKVVLFRFGSPPGYVEHDVPRSYTKRIVIAIAPLLLNLSLGTLLFAWSASADVVSGVAAMILGTIIIAASLPSEIDMESLIPYSLLGYLHPMFLISLPMIIVLYLISRFRAFGTNAIFTIGAVVTLFLMFHTSVINPPTLDAVIQAGQNLLEPSS